MTEDQLDEGVKILFDEEQFVDYNEIYDINPRLYQMLMYPDVDIIYYIESKIINHFNNQGWPRQAFYLDKPQSKSQKRHVNSNLR